MDTDPTVRLWRGRRRLRRVTGVVAVGAAAVSASLAGVFAAGTGHTTTPSTQTTRGSDDGAVGRSDDGSAHRDDGTRLTPPTQAPTSSSNGSAPDAHTGAS
jgi:hypothetical protein